MTAERQKYPVLLGAMLGLVFDDPQALLFGYAMAVSKGDEESLEIAKFFRENAETLGVTEEQFKNAVDIMKKTDEFLDNLDKTS